VKTPIEVKPGTVVRYKPDPSRHDPRWCREGMAIADERGLLIDTYWGSGQDAHILRGAELEGVEVLFHFDEFDELDRWRPNVQEWETYAPADRQRVTSQHGLQQRLFIRKGAEPDLATQIANAEEKVCEAEYNVESANRRLEWAREDLAKLAAVDRANS